MNINYFADAADSVKIVINKKVNKLAYFKNGVAVKIFPVATGRSAGLTPEGSFKVVRKLVKPYYSKLKIPGGSPRNPLGARWLGLNACNTSGGTYGIHGTNNPKSIGRYASGGCIRMFNQDVIWLYENTPMNTPVDIINGDWNLEPKVPLVVIDGKQLALPPDFQAYMMKGTVLVPCRYTAESFGCTVTWDGRKQQVTIKKGANIMIATVNSKELSVNGESLFMNEAVAIRNGRLFLPVRGLAEALGYSIAWDDNSFTVKLTTRDKSVFDEEVRETGI